MFISIDEVQSSHSFPPTFEYIINDTEFSTTITHNHINICSAARNIAAIIIAYREKNINPTKAIYQYYSMQNTRTLNIPHKSYLDIDEKSLKRIIPHLNPEQYFPCVKRLLLKK